MNEKADILIADDNINLVKTMSLILRRKGYRVTAARDGTEAIARVWENPFDIIFMDIKMPGMNGVETFKRIKQIQPEAVVMMMTAYAVEDLIQEALEEGAYGILYKPLDIEKVFAVIERSKEAGQSALILVVDDDPGSCITFKKILTRKNYEVAVAHTGEEAIERVKENSFDIIFIDVKMPTLNGLETYLAIKEINPEAAVIMITAYRQEADELVEKALQNSACTCLYKPLDMTMVLGLIADILQRK